MGDRGQTYQVISLRSNKETDGAYHLAWKYVDEIVKLHEVPVSIVSNRSGGVTRYRANNNSIYKLTNGDYKNKIKRSS